MSKLVCPMCGEETSVPVHCGREMHKDGDQLVCWMGAVCGVQELPKHCGQYMELKG